jgi:PAS domain S-box-containing protein
VHYSRQFQQMIGSPGEDFAQRFRFAERLHPDDHERVTAAVRRAIDRRQFFDEEYRLRRADGSYGWYRGRGRAHYAGDGAPVSFSGFLTDLTRQKAAEDALRASETRYRGLFESSPQPMWVHDLESMRFLAVNQAAVRAYGYGRDEFAAMTVLQLLCDGDGPGLLEALDVLPVDEPLQQATPWRHRRKDGTEMLVEVTSHRIVFGGNPAELVLAVDVTAAVEARRELHERERMLAALSGRLHLATRIAGLGVFEWDLRARRGIWNERLLAIFGLARDPAGGAGPPGTRALLDGFADDDRPRLQRMLRDAVAGLPSPGQGEEFRVTRPDGEAREVLVCAQVQLDDSGEPASVVFAIQDITERKRYDDARRAREAAELASRAKSEFLSRVSHELRTPLNAMLGFAQLLEHDRDPALAPPQLEQVRHIQRAGWHLLDMIDDVLDLSRIEAGRLRLAIEPLQAAAAVRDALPMVETLAHERGVRIVDRVPPRASRALLADPTRLRQVLVNLLSNAVKYSHAGGTVTVSCGQHRDRIAIAVADQGIGMGPEQLRRLFEPFDRLGAERHRIDGTGIGLVITRALLEMMGGSIEVWSERGAGTVFAAWLHAAPSSP